MLRQSLRRLLERLWLAERAVALAAPTHRRWRRSGARWRNRASQAWGAIRSRVDCARLSWHWKSLGVRAPSLPATASVGPFGLTVVRPCAAFFIEHPDAAQLAILQTGDGPPWVPAYICGKKQ